MARNENIGVFICSCNGEIERGLDRERLIEDVKGKGVKWVGGVDLPCSPDGLGRVMNAVRENGLERVVIAGCSPRVGLPVLRGRLEREGINPSFVEMANIREGCIYPHAGNGVEVKKKALDIIMMAAVRASFATPVERKRVEPVKKVLVIGGGVAGITAATTLLRNGIPVILVEKGCELGGLIRSSAFVFPFMEKGEDFMNSLVHDLTSFDGLDLMMNSRVESVQGGFGDYHVTIGRGDERIEDRVGGIIVAIGSSLPDIKAHFSGWGEKVVAMGEFESIVKEGVRDLKNVIFLLGVENFIPGMPGGRGILSVQTAEVLKNVALLSGVEGVEKATVLFDEIPARFGEDIRRLHKKGTLFIGYDIDPLPGVTGDAIRLKERASGETKNLSFDLLVLAQPLLPAFDSAKMARILGIPVDSFGFLLEERPKLRPSDYCGGGVMVIGGGHWPTTTDNAILQAMRKGNSMAKILSSRLDIKFNTAVVDREPCIACRMCESVCPFDAVHIRETDKGLKAVVHEASCKACGTCSACCPGRAITVPSCTDSMVSEQISLSLGG